ncbi:13702_t:CDS:2 [Acaulospora colombiana]|uniref:13702_t:CDS:1 n=1 Tax=Acaulospora colombiana TaxID=27376 RepID=A0ACA9PAT1_9GLOM|nr:13702_t:CDS:2 [Acaulospora colombiana]
MEMNLAKCSIRAKTVEVHSRDSCHGGDKKLTRIITAFAYLSPESALRLFALGNGPPLGSYLFVDLYLVLALKPYQDGSFMLLGLSLRDTR